jgi:hypothetical protein
VAREKPREVGTFLIRSDAMRIEVWRVPAVALVLGMAATGNANGGGAHGQSSIDATVSVVAVRGEAAGDARKREAAAQRALAQASAAVEARRPIVPLKSGSDTKPEAAELTLTGPAGGVRLSVRDQVPSGLVYRRLSSENSGGASCGGLAPPVAALNATGPSASPNEVRP